MDVQTSVAIALVALAAIAFLRHQARALGLFSPHAQPTSVDGPRSSSCSNCPNNSSCQKPSC